MIDRKRMRPGRRPDAVQLRYLQTLTVIAGERSDAIVLPVDLLGPLTQALTKGRSS